MQSVISRVCAFVFTTVVAAAANAGPLPVMPPPPALASSDYTWVYNGATGLGTQPDGLDLYDFNFTFTNTGTMPLMNVYDIIPDTPAVNFGKTDGTWDPTMEAWTANTSAGLVVAKPFNNVGFLDAVTPQYPVFTVTPYLAAGASTSVDLQFEFTPVVGYFTFPGYLAAVPEPSTIYLLLAGLLGMGWIVRGRFASRRI